MSCQETTGSDIAFAAIVHLGQAIPGIYLRCIQACRDMVTEKAADGNFEVKNGRTDCYTWLASQLRGISHLYTRQTWQTWCICK